MKYFFIVISTGFLLLDSCTIKKGESANAEPNQKEVYAFLNYLFSVHDSIGRSYISFVAEHDRDYDDLGKSNSFYESLVSADTSFKASNKVFLLSQIGKIASFNLDQQFIKGRKVISSAEIEERQNLNKQVFWERLRKKYKCNSFTAVTLPVFSEDHSTVAVASQYYTNYNGGGVIWVFKRKGSRWQYKDQLAFWDTD